MSHLCRLLALLLLPLTAVSVQAQGLDAGAIAQVQQLAQRGAEAVMPAGARVEVQVGQLAPQLKLAPCRLVQPYLPAGLHMWGRTRVGVRCMDGAARWNVSLPVQVKVYAKALVAAGPLPAGTVLTQEQLAAAEIDVAGEPGAVFTDAAELLGRTLSRPVASGEAVRNNDLSRRQWFAAGDTVQVHAAGTGFAIASEGRAVTPGLEGQDVKVRMDNGRTVTGRPVGERKVEVLL